ncbi:hypothetical protein PVK06_017956 [Gossypium arboreum]|uniref:Uncharacterized protein n=1 Tax=Gossypium arboreum TaxID=29729 RepID=A0ABR0Q5B2_GOSAR|nr:hypothetical protein PVK06_017956 [Gossypium arboreum]
MASFGLQFCFAARDQQVLFSELRKPPLYSITAYYPVDDFFVVDLARYMSNDKKKLHYCNEHLIDLVLLSINHRQLSFLTCNGVLLVLTLYIPSCTLFLLKS